LSHRDFRDRENAKSYAIEKILRTEKEEYTDIKILMSFHPRQNPSQGKISEYLSELVDSLRDYIISEKDIKRDSVYSVRYRPFQLQDAIVFVVKVNWKSYDGEDIVSFWD
jgi:hypothetical protein